MDIDVAFVVMIKDSSGSYNYPFKVYRLWDDAVYAKEMWQKNNRMAWIEECEFVEGSE